MYINQKIMKGGMLMQSSFKAKEDLPAVLSAKDISRYLGISKANSYQLMDSKGFPILRIGKRKLVPKDKFLIWINNNLNFN